jgi:ribonuclease T1
MKNRLGLALVLLGVLFVAPGPAAADRPAGALGCAAPTAERPRSAELPQKACAVLAEIQRRNGEPPPGHVGGRAFQNRERRLPRGSYREYDVDPKMSGRSRGAERIVIEQPTGKAYYTRDHYETFIPMN